MDWIIMAFVLGLWAGVMFCLLTQQVIKKLRHDKPVDISRVCGTRS